MPGPVPHALLLAACESFPLASASAHTHALLTLGRTPHDHLDAPTRGLADDLVEYLRPRARGLSLEAIRQTCERAWFHDAPARVPLADYLVLLANRHLKLRGPRIALRTEPSISEPLAHFRWLSLFLPPDLLVAALATTSSIEPASDHVDLCTPQLAKILDDSHPVAETHLHVGAAVSFDLLWTGLVSSLAHNPPDPKKLDRGGKPPFGTGERFLCMLQAAAITRLLLASYLWSRERRGSPASFPAFLDDAPSGLQAIAERASWPWGTTDFLRATRAALHTAVTGKHPAPPARLASLHRHLLGRNLPTETSSVDKLLRNDPLSAWLPPAEGLASPENRFTARGLRYLLNLGRDDKYCALAFWQYQRIRALTYRHLTVEPGTAGLDWFQQHYERISPLRTSIDGARFEAAIRLDAHGTHLRSLEARTAPAPAWRIIRDLTRDTATSAFVAGSAIPDRPEVGLVLHLLKQRDTTIPGKQRRLHADPRQIAHGCRFGAYAYGRLKEVLAIEAALEHMPELLLVLRGIDVASSELAVPTWALAPFFLRMRRASHRAAAALSLHRPGWRVQPLRATFHAGEDFRRLSEGIRRMHELLEFELLCAGDCIGHGLAAGTDPERWARDNHITTQPAEERLDDLLWEIDRYERRDLPGDAGRIEYVRAQARDLAYRLHGRHVDLGLLVEARRLRHDPRVLDRIGYPFTRGIEPTDPVEKLVHEHLTHAGLFLRGQRPEEIRADDGEVRMLRDAARWLRGRIATSEMTIETNPSSNLLIGDMQSVEQHPAFRFQPLPGRPDDGEEPVLLSINTDDPVSFATSIAHEFAYLYGALLRDRVSAHDALQWLERRREDGWRSRFTLAASANADAVRELIPPEERARRGLLPRERHP